MEYLTLVLFLVLSSSIASPPAVTKHYRTDYIYNAKTDAFYKLHVETCRQSQMADICKVEGATPMAYSSDDDLAQVHKLMKKYPDLGDLVWIADDGNTHEPADEQPIIDLSASRDEPDTQCEVFARSGDIKSASCYQRLPFVCKVQAKDAPYSERCRVYGANYEYYPVVGSCYKIPDKAYPWNQAAAECRAEGAHLAVVNSETEREILQNITNAKHAVDGATTTWFFFAGFRAEKTTGNTPRVFLTVQNQTLEQAGCSAWSKYEPNNSGGREYCGSIFKNDGYFNDVNCANPFAFICENEVS